MIVLSSGLPLRRSTSFSRQLNLLASNLRKIGIEARVTGPSPEEYTPSSREPDRKSLRGRFDEKSATPGPVRAAILLGYPDQFPLLHTVPPPRHPVFLWSQFSRPPDPKTMEHAVAVPLTPRTKQFLMEAGVTRIGPSIPHGIDASLFRPMGDDERLRERRRLGVQGCFVIGTVGAHTARKRLGSIVKTAAQMRRKNPKVRLVIKTNRRVSGDGVDLHLLAGRAGILHGSLILTDTLTDPEMRSLYCCMDMYLNLSEWEGFCIPVLEAMACGIPVAAPRAQGPGEIIPYGDLEMPAARFRDEGGALLCRAEPREAAEVLHRASGSRGLLRRTGELGIREVRQRYDIGLVARQWAELINPARQTPGSSTPWSEPGDPA
jgi:glycosyltransferase involved in cell wall biosynthesis